MNYLLLLVVIFSTLLNAGTQDDESRVKNILTEIRVPLHRLPNITSPGIGDCKGSWAYEVLNLSIPKDVKKENELGISLYFKNDEAVKKLALQVLSSKNETIRFTPESSMLNGRVFLDSDPKVSTIICALKRNFSIEW